MNTFMSEVVAKRLGLFREFLPGATRFAALVNPNAATTEAFVQDFTEAAATLNINLGIVRGRRPRDRCRFRYVAGNKRRVMVAPDTFFATHNVQIVTFAMRHAIPAVYTVRAYVEHGGLMSYGPSLQDTYRQLAIYVARIPRATSQADLPVVQATKLDLVINMPTARALGIDVPASLLARADDVIGSYEFESRYRAPRRVPGRSRRLEAVFQCPLPSRYWRPTEYLGRG